MTESSIVITNYKLTNQILKFQLEFVPNSKFQIPIQLIRYNDEGVVSDLIFFFGNSNSLLEWMLSTLPINILPPPHFFGRWNVEKCTSSSEKYTSSSEKINSRSEKVLLEVIFSLLEVHFSLLGVHFSTSQRPKKWGGGSRFFWIFIFLEFNCIDLLRSYVLSSASAYMAYLARNCIILRHCLYIFVFSLKNFCHHNFFLLS